MHARPVLLIDDDAAWCAQVCRFLESHGIAVVSAANVASASGRLELMGKPSAVVMDIATRAEHGRAVTLLRTDNLLSDVPLGYVKKSAALDGLLLMLSTTADGQHLAA